MKKYKEFMVNAIILLMSSGVLYYINYFIFRNIDNVIMYFIQDLAFIPIQILIVTLIINRIIERKEKAKIMGKLNMVIGVFFNEVGEDLLRLFIGLDYNIEKIKNHLAINDKWQKKDYEKAKRVIKDYEHTIVAKKVNIVYIENLLGENKDFFIKLLENPVLLEHETFTDLLQALFHLYGEVVSIKKYPNFEHRDIEHIAGDIERAYSLLSYEWLVYMEYVQNEYPYLFSTSVKNNPYII